MTHLSSLTAEQIQAIADYLATIPPGPSCGIQVDKKCLVLNSSGPGEPADACTTTDGAEVEYTFTVTNIGNTDIENISMIDDILGEIPGSPIAALAIAESVTLSTTALIVEDTTNTVTVTGETVGSGTNCEAADAATVSTGVTAGSVAIDIKPRKHPNKINPRSRLGVWVAVLSDAEAPFDPLQIDIPTVRFGPDEARVTHHRVRDINRDGLGDLILRFRIRQTGIECGDTAATLKGETFDGQAITGTDSITTVRCKN